MEIISKISKGSRMDQIYIPKNRHGFGIGDYVIIKPIEIPRGIEKPYFYNIKNIEPIKVKIIEEIFSAIDKNINTYSNIIITGSFLEKGFTFNDIDVIIVSEKKQNSEVIKKLIEQFTGITTHIIVLENKTLITGLSIDPLYQTMLSKCISKSRLIYKTEPKIEYKLLDINLLKSKIMFDNFDLLDGNEKYYLTRNMITINLFLKKKKLDKGNIDKEIINLFELEDISKVKKNMLDKKEFLKRYKEVYEGTFNLIMDSINVSK